MKTVYIIGAGANKEVKLPTGYELKKDIAEKLTFSFDFERLENGNYEILAAFKFYSKNNKDTLKKLLTASLNIKNALPQAISIDNYLDAHRNDKYIQKSGKIGIAFCILNAERNSLLSTINQNKNMNFSVIEKTWYYTFFQTLTENCQITDLTARLKDLGIIIFNYDRCFEYFLYYALQNYYLITPNESASIIKSMNIIHPYGVIGNLPFQNNKDCVEFGGKLNPELLLKLADRIKTFNESVIISKKLNTVLYDYIENIEKIVFLGFAYHKMNINLLFPEPIDSSTHRNYASQISCYGSTYQISENDLEIIIQDLQKMFSNRLTIKFSNLTCAEFMKNNRRCLSF